MSDSKSSEQSSDQEKAGGNPTREHQPGSSGAHPRLNGVSVHWRTLSVALVVAFVVIASFEAYAATRPAVQETFTKVDWSHFTIPAGPGPSANDSNYTNYPELSFCAPSGATTVGLFSMVWSSSSGAAIQSMVIFLILPPTTGHSLGSPEILYEGFNESSGGTSIISFYPNPCGYQWTFAAQSSFAVSVNGVITFTYNYTTG